MNLINWSAVCLDSSIRKINIDGSPPVTVLGLSFVQQCHSILFLFVLVCFINFVFWFLACSLTAEPRYVIRAVFN